MKKKIVSLALILIMIVTLVGCGGSTLENGQPTKVVIGIQSMVNDQNLAKAEKYFEEEFGDIEVEFVSFDSGKNCVNAMVAGSVDFICVGTAPAISGLSNGLDAEIVWLDQVLNETEGVVVKKNSGINTLADLKGKKVATPSASTSDYFLEKGVEEAGVKSDEYTLLDMQPDEIYAAWGRGDIDAASLWNPVLGQLVNDGGKIIYTAGQAAKAGDVTADVTMVSKKFADSCPELVVKYIKASEKAMQLYSSDKAKTISSMAESMELSEKDVKSEIDGSKWVDGQEQLKEEYLGGHGFSEDLYKMACFLYKKGNIKNEPRSTDYDYVVNPKYLKEALGK